MKKAKSLVMLKALGFLVVRLSLALLGHLLELEMLISPTQYFAGAYPFCLEVVEAAKGEIFENVSRIPSATKRV